MATCQSIWRIAALTTLLYVSAEADDLINSLSLDGFDFQCMTHDVAVKRCRLGDGCFAGFAIAIVNMRHSFGRSMDTVRCIREASEVPILCLSSAAGIGECVAVLELGADEYLRAPVEEQEFAARLRALMRRPTLHDTQKAKPLVVDDLELHPGEKRVVRSGELLKLTAVEFDILHLLVQSLSSVVTRDEISRTIFGSRTTIRHRSIDVHISSLRKKLGQRDSDDQRIRTIRGTGYVYTRLH